MPIKLTVPKIIKLDDDRCLTFPRGGWVKFNSSGDVLDWSEKCVVTFRGYERGQEPLWEGAVAERLHPWPLPESLEWKFPYREEDSVCVL